MLNTHASSFRSPPTPPADWAITEFGPAELGDDRRTARLLMIATALAHQPTAAIPQACGPVPATPGGYRFFENDDLDAEALRDAHPQATLERVRPPAIVLALQDISTLNYSTHPQTQGLGPIGSHRAKTIGLLPHSTLAVTPNGQPLGLLHTAARARDPKAAGSAQKRHAKPIAEKESQKWLDRLSACQQVAPACAHTTLVNVADRAGDLDKLFAQALAPPPTHRSIGWCAATTTARSPARTAGCGTRLAGPRADGRLPVRVGRRGAPPARLATRTIRFRQVPLAAPARKAEPPPLTLWAIEARETRPPKGARPILWRLLPTLPVTRVEEAGEQVTWSAQRWPIEVLHKVLKSGGRVEQRPWATDARLARALAVDPVVAWRLLALCQAARWIAQLGGFMGPRARASPLR